MRSAALRPVSESNITMARKYLGLNEAEGFHWGMIRGGMSSVADTFVVQMQDCLGLGAYKGRMAALPSLAGVSPPASSALPCTLCPPLLFCHEF